MNKVDRVLSFYAIGALPFIIILMIWSYSSDPTVLSMSEGIKGFFWDSLGWIFMAWILVSLYLALKMVISRYFRTLILSKIAGIKDRDERESIISGEKAKFSFLSSAALMLFLLFLSMFTVKIAKSTDPKVEEGKKGYISVGMNIKPFSSKSKMKEINNDIEIFTYNGVPLSSTSILMIILLWQFMSYRLFLNQEILD